MKRNRLLGVVLASITSCVEAPPVSHPDIGVEPPAEWTARAGSGPVDKVQDWWEQFGAEELDAVVEEVLAQNYDLGAALARVDAAVAQARISGADLLPGVDATLDGSRQKFNFIGFPIPGGDSNDVLSTRSTRFDVALSTSWEIDLWGRIREGQAAALADVQAAQADFAAIQQSLAALACAGWFAAVEARQQLELAQRTAVSFRNSSDWIRERYEQGVRSPLELRLSISNLASAEAAVALFEEQLDAATRSLESLLGRYPSGTLPIPSTLPPVPPPAPAGLPAELVSRRPDLARAERELAASNARVNQARAALYPRLSLTASGGTATEDFGDLLAGDFSVWSLAGNLTQPIFDGGRLRAGVDLSKSSADAALAEYAASVLEAYSEVESALAAEGFLAEREAALATAFQQADGARILAEEQYRAGLVGLLLLLESQRRSANAESHLIETRRSRLEARARLHLSLGGGFAPASEDPDASSQSDES